MELAAGHTLANYEIIEVLGRGGMGVVYRARHVNLDRPAAVKVLHDDLTADREFVERFTQEARLAAQLDHPHIATVYDFGCADGHYYIAMELADGVPLSRMLSEPIPLDLAVSVLKQVSGALAAAHQAGVVHRDLKPANILVNARGDAVLTDFGIAKSVRSQGLTVAGTLVGTPEYMAPEQALANPVDARTDIYALGVILYETCVGSPPFQEDTAVQTAMKHVRESMPTVRTTVPDLPEWVDPVVQRCCAKEPASRYQTVEEFSASLPREVQPPIAVYPDVMARTGTLDFSSTLTAILRGEETPEQVVQRAPEWEQAIRSALEREVTVASLDIVGSRGMKAPGQTLVLSYLFEQLRRFIDTTCDEQGCFARSWSGDGLAAVFSDPLAAVRAMQQIVRALPEFESPDPAHPFRVRVGVHSGRVLLRETGELGRVTSRVFDTAGHLQKSCKPDEIRASEAVVQAAGLQGEFSPLERIDDVYAWVWWGPSTGHEAPGRPAPARKAAPRTRKRLPVALLVAAAVALLLVGIGVGGWWLWQRHRASQELAALRADAATGALTSPPPSAGAVPSAGLTGESLPTKAAHGTPPETPAPSAHPVTVAARLLDVPADAVVSVGVVETTTGAALALGADGTVTLPGAGNYEFRVYYQRGRGSTAISPSLAIRYPSGSEQRFRVEKLWPERNAEGSPIASTDQALKRACTLAIAQDGSMQLSR